MGYNFTDNAWSQYTSWGENRRITKKINDLIKDIARNGNSGIGKPEQLRGNLAGYWSRRIDEQNRLVYTIQDEDVIIISCKGHYE
ncbi:MAG: Txe/YoeB family addiction module toxin [Coriobacteriales bacterium]|jgi:toxin YoeB|nr:Txe/YoeB family addiction module toxin [Coriobacteriales bacterium]